MDKMEPDLVDAVEQADAHDVIEVLVYPNGAVESLRDFLASKEGDGVSAFNVLELAGCVAVRARPDVITSIADRDDVHRVTVNPTFTTNVRERRNVTKEENDGNR